MIVSFDILDRPIPSLQGMDKGGNVIYLSTFSKSLMPSLRIAYMVLPPILLNRYEKAFIHYSATVPRLDQHILARFMADGHFSRHLNRMRKIYKRKLQVLTEALCHPMLHMFHFPAMKQACILSLPFIRNNRRNPSDISTAKQVSAYMV